MITCAGDMALNGIVVSPTDPTLPVGATMRFTATAYYNDQTTGDITTEVSWSSSDPSVATIDSSGLATAVAVGTTTITATSSMSNSYSGDPSTSDSTTLTVTSAALLSISITPANPTLPPGTVQQFTATGTYSDGKGYDITSQVSWSSLDPSVATVSDSGLATAVAAGTATVTATYESISGSTVVTVPSG